MFDHDVITDDPISTLEIGTGYLPYGFPVENWFTLESVKGEKKKGGQVHLVLQINQKGKAPFQNH